MRIDLDSFDRDAVLLDSSHQTVATIRFIGEVCYLSIENNISAIQFIGKGKAKSFTIHSEVPCEFSVDEWHFSDLILTGGPYAFPPGSTFTVKSLMIDGESQWLGVNLIAEHSIELTLSSQSRVQDIFIQTKDLIFNSHSDGVIELKKIKAHFDRLGISEGQYHFIDSQLQDHHQTTAQLGRFSDGLSTYQFQSWHRAQAITIDDEDAPIIQEIRGEVQFTHSTLLTAAILLKQGEGEFRAIEGSIVAAQEFQLDDNEENGAALFFSNSLFISQIYYQSRGKITLDHSAWCVNDTLFARDDAMVILNNESYVTVGNEINLNRVDWHSHCCTISSKVFSAYSESRVLIEDVARPLAERYVRWKADQLSSNAYLEVRNMVARFCTWGHLGALKYDNFTAIVDREILAARHSQIQGNKWVLDTRSLFLNGEIHAAESTFWVTRDSCVVGDDGHIVLRGNLVGRFCSWDHLGRWHMDHDSKENRSHVTAKVTTLHQGSKVIGDRFDMDVDDIRLLGDIDLRDDYHLMTKKGFLKGSIQSKGTIDLAADYFLTLFGARFYAQDVRFIGNCLSFLGEVQATRSYSRVGGLMLDSDFVVANNIATTSLFSASLGLQLPNPNVSLEDLFSQSNVIRTGLTLLNLMMPSVSSIANAAYFMSRIALSFPTFKSFRSMRLHQWMGLLGYLNGLGLSAYSSFSHFKVDQPADISLNFESIATQFLPTFISGEMNNSLIIVNGGFNVLGSSLNNAIVVEDVGIHLHINDAVNAVMISHSGVDIAVDRVETAEIQETQGLVINRLHTLLAQHWHLVDRSHEIVSERVQGNIVDFNNEGDLSVQSQKHDSILHIDRWENKNKLELTGVTVDGLQFISQEQARAHLHDVVFHNKIHVDNGRTSYTGYYVIQTKHYTHAGEQAAQNTSSQTIFSLMSDDAEFQGVVHNNKVHLEIKQLKNIQDFLEGKGAYADYHVATAVELVSRQALELQGLRHDCDISITAPDVHFNHDANFERNVFIRSTHTMTIDHDMRSSQYLCLEANGKIILHSGENTLHDPFEKPPALNVTADKGLYIKSDHDVIEGQGLHTDGYRVCIEAEKNITLDKKEFHLPDFHSLPTELQVKIYDDDSDQYFALYNEYRAGETRSVTTALDGHQVLLVSHAGNVHVNGESRANDAIQMVADKGHVAIEGTLASDNRVNIIADTGFTLLSKKTIKQGVYDELTEWDSSQISAGKSGIHVEVKHGDAIVDSSNLSAKGNIVVEADNINEQAHTNTYISDVEEHKGFLGFNSHKSVTQSTDVFRSHLSSDAKIILQAHHEIHSEGADFEGNNGTYLLAENGIRLYDVMGHVHTVDKSSSLWGLTFDKTTQDEEFNVPTVIFDHTEIGLHCRSGDVDSMGSTFISPDANFSGENVLFNGRVLDNEDLQKTRGLHVSISGINVLSSHSTYKPFQYHNASFDNIQTLLHSHGFTETALNAMNAGIDFYNTGESILSNIKNHHFADSIWQQVGISPTVEIGIDATHQHNAYQTLADGGIYFGNMTVNAHHRALFSGLPVEVTGDAVVHAENFDQLGVSLKAEYSSSFQDFTMGFSTPHVDYASFTASQSSMQSEAWSNQMFSVGRHLEVDAKNWTLANANVDAGRVTANISGKLTEITQANTTQSQSASLQFSSIGDVGVSASKQNEQHIDQVSGIHAHDDSAIHAQSIDLQGARITSEGKMDVTAETINGEEVKTYSHSNGGGISGNIHSFWHRSTEENASKQMDTFSVSNNGLREREIQVSVIHGEKGTSLHAHTIHGSIDTTDSDGRDIDQHQQWDYQANVPILKFSHHNTLTSTTILPSSSSLETPIKSDVPNQENHTVENQIVDPVDVKLTKIPLGTALLNEWKGAGDFLFAPSSNINFWASKTMFPGEFWEAFAPVLEKGVTKVVTKGVTFAYDQVHEAISLLSLGYLGDPDSLARNEERGRDIYHYFPDLVTNLYHSHFGTEEQGALLGEAFSWFAPRVNILEATGVGTFMKHARHAGLAATVGLFAPRPWELFGSGIYYVHPDEVRFSQPTINPYLSTRQTVSELAAQLASGEVSPLELPTIQVVQKNGHLFSLDNRRLAAFSLAELDKIPIEIVSLGDPELIKIYDPGLYKKYDNHFNPINGEGRYAVAIRSSERADAFTLMLERGMIEENSFVTEQIARHSK